MYLRLDDFIAAYQVNAEGTGKVLNQLTNRNLNQQVVEGHRNLGQIAWHMVTSVVEMAGHTGLKVTSVSPEAPPPKTAAAIKKAYPKVVAELVKQLQANWDDDSLMQEDDMYGQKWPRGFTLDILLRHEIHHRGQMTILLRQAGARVPGTCGPALEEWTQYGKEPPAY